MKHPSKFLKVFIVLMIVLLSFAMLSYGHSGRTDSQGGHTDHSTCEYHYHHGHPAHQHPGGVCPYEDDSAGGLLGKIGITAAVVSPVAYFIKKKID